MIKSNFLNFLKEPFPEEGDFKKEVITDGVIGLFVFLFLFLFQPFSLDELNANLLLKHTFFFGIITFVIGTLFHAARRFLIKVEFDKPSWTFGRWLLSTIQLVLLISIMNFLYLSLISNIFDFSWPMFWNLIYSTFLIAIFPVLFAGLLKVRSGNIQNQKIAEGIQSPDKNHNGELQAPIKIDTEQGIETINLNTFIYAEAAQNYVSIHSEGEPTKMIRIPMSTFSEMVLTHNIIRVHRSYIVMVGRITDVNGNAQGLNLSMDGTASIIPVSRKYIPTVRALM